MSFAEIVFRIGVSVGGWLIFLGLCLTLAVIPQADCDPGSDTLWRGTLFFGLLSALGLGFVGRGLEWSRSLRWLALPSGALALYAALGIVPALAGTTLGGESLCAIAGTSSAPPGGIHASSLERAWPVAQLAVLAFGCIQVLRCVRAAGRSAAH